MVNSRQKDRPVLLQANGICKEFPGVLALKNVHIRITGGEVHCLIGENGAGKSTLVKIVTGVQKADSGTVRIHNQDASDNKRLFEQVAYVPQELDLFPSLSVAENLFMPFSRSGVGGPFVSLSALAGRAEPVLRDFRMTVDPLSPVDNISISNRQLLQIARARVMENFDILIMDEPTTSLSDNEVVVLFDLINELRAEGKGIVFISHKLNELLSIGDTVSVLRNGEIAGEKDMSEVDTGWIIERMSGSDVNVDEDFRPTLPAGEEILQIRNLSGQGFQNVSLEIRRGEVLGLAGLVGAGRSELAQTLFGYLRADSGMIFYLGRRWRGRPNRAVRCGMVYLPEERKQQAILPHLSVQHNIGVSLFDITSRFSWISNRRETEFSEEIIKQYGIKVPAMRTAIMFLSGGNQQKVVIGRAGQSGHRLPKLIIFDEPTKGIDVKTKVEIHRTMFQMAKTQRIAVVLISSELDEIMRCSNRIITMYQGNKTGEFTGDSISRDGVMRAMIGEGNKN